jgi:hypothetical protein
MYLSLHAYYSRGKLMPSDAPKTMHAMKLSKLSEKERERFNMLIEAIENDRIALVRSSRKGSNEEVALICGLYAGNETEEVLVHPFAVLLDESQGTEAFFDPTEKQE